MEKELTDALVVVVTPHCKAGIHKNKPVLVCFDSTLVFLEEESFC